VLALYAALSAAYLLLYKDVWEHHYVLLQPPLILLALASLRKDPGAPSARTWLPPFVIAALPTLFVFYDLPALGYNEDPQRYWLPAVSLLHHATKPLAPLWLLTALVLRSVRESVALPRLTFPRWTPVAARFGLFASCALAVCLSAPRVVAAIRAQHRVARVLVWPAGVFRPQERREYCGPAALAAVARHFGREVQEEEVARLAGTDARGTTMLGLREAAEKLGLAVQDRRARIEDLEALPKPAILFYSQGHFAVLTGVSEGRFYLADPSLGQRCWGPAELRRFWHGELLLVGPGTGTSG
jgi:hypothetical protein